MKQILKDLSNLRALVNTYNVTCDYTDISTLEDKLSKLQDLIPTLIRTIEDADKKRGLFSDRANKPCPQQIPSYAGTPSEDFITFKDKFNKAVEDNRISKTDQLEKL